VLSGLIARDVPGVLSAYAAQKLQLARRRDLDGWATLVLQRGGAGRRPRTVLDRRAPAPAGPARGLSQERIR
jgi:ribosomal protein L11 methyltransferase